MSTTIPIPTPSFSGSPPSVPKFTVQLIGPNFTQPTTYSLDQSTGQIMAQIGYTNQYSYLVITIKNQPFAPFNDSQGNPIGLFYQIQIKNHNETDSWRGIYRVDDGYPIQTENSEYTELSIGVEGADPMGVPMLAGNQIDIQVNANEGYFGRELVAGTIFAPYVFVGLTSEWSNTQTEAISANVPLSLIPAPSSSTQTPASTATSAPQSAINLTLLLITAVAIVVIAFLTAVIVFLLLHFRKRETALSKSQNELH